MEVSPDADDSHLAFKQEDEEINEDWHLQLEKRREADKRKSLLQKQQEVFWRNHFHLISTFFV